MTLFKKKTDTPAPEKVEQAGNNPYLNARQEWLERYGSYISRASQWRAMCLVALVICLLSIACNVIQANQVKTIPYIVEVDKTGNLCPTMANGVFLSFNFNIFRILIDLKGPISSGYA